MAEEPAIMRLVTWNIQWGRGCDGRVDLARIARVARETADFDVLCLQEVAVNFPGLPGSQGEDQVALLREAFPGYQAFYGVATDLPDGRGGRSGFGNLILSRLPVLQVFRHLLPWPADPGVSSMQRICVEAVVEFAFGPVRVMTTHLEYYSRKQRLMQVQALREIHRQAAAHARSPRSAEQTEGPFAVLPRGQSAILCGDLNFKPGDAEHGVMTWAYEDDTPRLVDAWLAAHYDEPHHDTVGLHGCEWPDSPYCCDFVFVTDDLLPRLRGVRVNQDTDASDHQPVVLELGD
jgi:endonuclease/exonuclease/phosphatase family metal-dependent hydrolase